MSKVKLKVKKGDNVIVITGKDKGKSGKILSVNPSEMTVVIDGVNMSAKHLKPTKHNPQGGKIAKAMPMHLSNVQLQDPKSGLPTRVGYKMLEDGKKVRFAKRSGEIIG